MFLSFSCAETPLALASYCVSKQNVRLTLLHGKQMPVLKESIALITSRSITAMRVVIDSPIFMKNVIQIEGINQSMESHSLQLYVCWYKYLKFVRDDREISFHSPASQCSMTHNPGITLTSPEEPHANCQKSVTGLAKILSTFTVISARCGWNLSTLPLQLTGRLFERPYNIKSKIPACRTIGNWQRSTSCKSIRQALLVTSTICMWANYQEIRYAYLWRATRKAGEWQTEQGCCNAHLHGDVHLWSLVLSEQTSGRDEIVTLVPVVKLMLSNSKIVSE